MMYRKYGYGRGCSQISVDVREDLISREEALKWVHQFVGLFPEEYAGVRADEAIDQIGMDWGKFLDILNMYTNWELFEGQKELRPILKC